MTFKGQYKKHTEKGRGCLSLNHGSDTAARLSCVPLLPPHQGIHPTIVHRNLRGPPRAFRSLALVVALAHLCCRVDSSPVLDPVRRPRWDVLKEGGFSSKFKDAFNALLSDVIPCGGDGQAVRWPHREASPAGPDEKLRSKTLLCNGFRSRRT